MDSEQLKLKAEEAAEAVKQFNRRPPQWFYWALGIGIVLLFQLLRHL